MVGKYCRVEPLELETHAAELYEAYARAEDDRNWTYLLAGPFDDFAAYEAWLKAAGVRHDPQFHAVIDPSGKAVGIASYLRIRPSVGVIEVGHIHYSPQMQKTPMATEVMYLMMRRVFDELGYRRYEWKCDALNARSRQAAIRLGFTFEGIFRQATMYKGRNRDTAWYSIIDKDWPALEWAFRRWLDRSNFAANEQQKKSLGTLIKQAKDNDLPKTP